MLSYCSEHNSPPDERVLTSQQKIIDLRPGKYTFEGARPGYRSKLVEVTIPPGTLLTVVEVICDEPI